MPVVWDPEALIDGRGGWVFGKEGEEIRPVTFDDFVPREGCLIGDDGHTSTLMVASTASSGWRCWRRHWPR